MAENKKPSGLITVSGEPLPFPSTIENFQNELKTNLDTLREIIDAMGDLGSVNRDTQQDFRNLLKSMSVGNEILSKDLRQLATKQSNALKDTNELIYGLETSSTKIQKQIINNSRLAEVLTTELGKANLPPELKRNLGEQKENLEKINKLLKEYNEKIKNTPALRLTEGIEKFTKDIPVLGSLIKNVTDPLKEGIKEAFSEGKEGIDALMVGLSNLKTIGLQALYALFITSLFEVNKQTTELQKNLGISSAQAQNLRAGFAQTAANAGDLFITSAKLQKSFNEFSGELGGAVKNSGQVLETFANLTGRFGLNTQEAAKLTSILGLQNENTEQVLKNTIKTINASRSSGKEFLNTKEIIKDISNVSFNVIATLGKSPDILAKAATRARELGLNLEQVEKIADSLLNFESSISAELTAELLTGKQLNLERARFLALNNDVEGVMNEINKQGINFTEFTKMNRIAQEGLANVLGMSRSEMTEMLFKQEQQTLQIKASKGELDKQTLAQFKALDAQEKFNLAVEKAKAAFSDIVIVFSPVLDLIAKLADWFGDGADEASKLGATMGTVAEGTEQVERSMKKALGYTLALIAASATYSTISGAILAKEKAKTAEGKSQTIFAALKAAFVGGPVAALAGLAAAAVVGAGVIALTNTLVKPTEDLIAPADGSPLLLKRGQAPIQGIPDDNVIFTTNNISSPINNISSPILNMQPLIDRLDKLERTLVEYRSVPVVIENSIDGRELNRNTINGLRKGYLTTPSVYT
jgi:galactitol-specific phosphotransferase system IIB component